MENNCLSCTQCCKGQDDSEIRKGNKFCTAKDGYTRVHSCEQYINRFGRKMTKSDLQHGMLVRTFGSRWGMVIKEDGTDKDCIKFFYDDKTSINHGFLDVPEVLSLSEVNDDLTIGKCWNEEDQCYYSAYSIDYVFGLEFLWMRPDGAGYQLNVNDWIKR